MQNILWEATLTDGTVVVENTRKWADIQDQVSDLSIVYNNDRYRLPSKQKSYFQGKSASADMNTGEITIYTHFIGCVLEDGKKLRIDFFTETNEAKINVF